MTDPARIGIVDMGSNAVRFLVAEATGGKIAILENHRLPVRLGRDVFHTGQIPEATISATVDAFRRFRATCDRLGVGHVRAMATSAMRDARNRDLLVDRVREACNIEIDVISGTQEAYLLKLGVETRVDLREGRSLLVDVGGGSVEVVLLDKGQVITADSYRLGALRMLEALADTENSGESFVELLDKHLRSLERRIADRFGSTRIDRYVAVGGNVESIADLVFARSTQRRHEGVEYCTLDEMRAEVAELAAMPVADRMSKRGLKEDRADTIVPAGIVYTRLGELAGVDRVLVPRVGIKDGLLMEVVQGHFETFHAEDHVDVVLSSCRAMGRRFHYESDHAEAVLTIARHLFDQTRELHGLGGRARVLLEAAALLHDVGVAVNNDGHHKHSQYLIEASELVGLSEEERHFVALLARYHRKGPPSRDHEEFETLRRRDRTMIERLAALLRIADALDRQHAAVVRGVAVKIREDSVELRPILASDTATRLTLEAKAVEEKGALFAALFGRRPNLVAP
ncbi:MAG: Ppx/GppA family phosphatase [Planctomycetes bacterium]|nr:Ppx/GppA family phosphatase [Planctomycetota bacterium]